MLLAGLVALLYLLLGLEIIEAEGIGDVDPGPATPLVLAGVVFAALTLLLVLRPTMPTLGVVTVTTILVVLAYVAIATEPEPAYEPWGLTLKFVQLVLLAVLVQQQLPSARSHGVADGTTRLGGTR